MADSANPQPTLLPGFGRPLNYEPMVESPYDSTEESILFPNALDQFNLEYGKVARPLLTLREIAILGYIDHITDKENWNVKIFDEGIQDKWKAEMLEAKSEQDINVHNYHDYNNDIDTGVKMSFSKAMADWVIAEVKDKAGDFKKDGFISVYPGQVIKSDTAVPATLRDALADAAKVLEDVPEQEKDWHPGSDGKVLDLVHPSLFPLVYGKSRVLRNGILSLEDCIKRCGEGDVAPVPSEREAGMTDNGTLYSRNFQWLPCDVSLNGDRTVKIESYINNLHPQKHTNLYNLIEQIIARVIPLWDAALTPLLPANSEVHDYSRIVYEYCEYEAKEEEEDEGEDDDEDFEFQRVPKVVQPEPGVFFPAPQIVECVDLFKDYKEQGLQVIVKMANIELTPEKPSYNGGTWHVEGQLNEHICASAIYYYDSHNITESRLEFRHQGLVDDVEDVAYAETGKEWIDQVFGCRHDGPSVQYLGSTTTPEGRLLVWPNILQHRVSPFELEDKTKRGWRKILALFLVDPHLKVISTANVPVQRKDWWAEHTQEAVARMEESGSLASLPPELKDWIMGAVPDFPLSMEEAKALRVELMAERREWQKDVTEAFHMHRFALCEH